MRWMPILLAVQILCAGCHGLPRPPVNVPAPVKVPESYRLPNTSQMPAGELIFHSDFELPPDHRLIRELAARGNAVLLISSELPEVIAISHRILVMRQGALSSADAHRPLLR